jgi:Tfp pilus assembly protein PilV
MNCEPNPRPPVSPRDAAFTLLEVMIAMAIFFIAIFAILSLVAQNLRMARSLGLGEVDFGSVAAQIAQTNALTEGTVSGDFGDAYPGASWNANITMVSTNQGTLASRRSEQGLFQVDITIDWPQNGLVRQETNSILLYRNGTGQTRMGNP